MEKIKFEKDLTINNDLKVLCEGCKKQTKHKVISSINERGEQVAPQQDWDFHWHTDYEIIQCQGCENISFRSVYSDSESYDQNGFQETVKIFPKRHESMRDIKAFYYVPNKLRQIYRETIDCYNSDLYILCGAGIRSIVEALCISHNIADGEVEETKKGISVKIRKDNLQGKINGLFEKGILTKESAESLHHHRFLGNKSLHEIDPPSKNELNLALDIIEIILENIYEIPIKTHELKNHLNRKK